MMPLLSENDRRFLVAVQALMDEYQVSCTQLLQILDRDLPRRGVTGPTPQPLRTYRNPNTGRAIRVRAGRSPTYRAWVAQYGQATVATWRSEPE
ncbi:hypothetical protein E8F11_11450 [Pseudomonas sp. BN417]|uniref:hypothetical protein n=1 Tax=Pseudomonas sp. BN417 TaxID=2567890 RepID=UPI002455217E|nr:hypothetical protein [Pseudomonas sp. BN417]MDH4555778.1 hypothetical protein [Pseudomonas sp. BN417]